MQLMRRLPPLLATVVLTVPPLAACGEADRSPDTEETAVDPSPSSEPTSPSSPGPTGDVGRAVDDLAAAIGIAAAEVEVVSTEEVTWRDGSRGCAKPGEMYTQALVDGLRITLRAEGRTYEYHSGGSRPPALCEKPTE